MGHNDQDEAWCTLMMSVSEATDKEKLRGFHHVKSTRDGDKFLAILK
jgi:hypothetical protein